MAKGVRKLGVRIGHDTAKMFYRPALVLFAVKYILCGRHEYGPVASASSKKTKGALPHGSAPSKERRVRDRY